MSKITEYAFWLIVLLILVVYWKGVKENTKAFGGALQKLIMTLQGRDPRTGNFEDYPQ